MVKTVKAISVMRLGELLGGTRRVRRRALIQAILDDHDNFRMYYHEALSVIKKGLRTIDNEEERLAFWADEILKIESLREVLDLDSREYNRLTANIKAVEIVQHSGAFSVKAIEFLPKTTYRRSYENFDVTLSPDLVFRTSKGLAGIKMRASNETLASEHQKAITAMMVCYLEEFFPGEKIDYASCRLFDLLAGQSVKATKNNKKALGDLDELCREEIAPQINKKLKTN